MTKDNINNLAESYFTDFETRFWRGEKDAFVERTKEAFRELGFSDSEISVHKSFVGGKNLVVGKADADILFTAHYDTPAKNGFIALPFSKTLGMGVASILGIIILLVLLLPAPDIVLNLLGICVCRLCNPLLNALQGLWPLIVLALVFLVKNPHNRNDNTSGCLGVLNTAALIAENPELKEKCAFVLFDREELGLLGSNAFVTWRRKHYPGKESSLVINMDCIANGNLLGIASRNKPNITARRNEIADFMQKEGFETVKKNSSLFGYMSDHCTFKNGVMLTFLRRSRLGGLYIPNIHTKKDTVCDLEQIGRLCEAVVKYAGGLQ